MNTSAYKIILTATLSLLLACSEPQQPPPTQKTTQQPITLPPAPQNVGLAALVKERPPVEQKDQQKEKLEAALEAINKNISETPSGLHHRRAGILFRLNRFEEAIQDYDDAVEIGRPHTELSCWERGLAYYYIGNFKEGKEQFERYHRVGATDIENGLWRFLCIAEVEGIEKARSTILEYPSRTRPPFPALLNLYLGKGTPEDVISQAKRNTRSGPRSTNNLFFAHYYLAKFYELTDQPEQAKTHIRKALAHEITHFMYYCAEIDAQRIDPPKNADPEE